MEELINRSCCFIGHRKIDKSVEFNKNLYNEIEKLVNSGVDIFFFGSKSQFDSLCYSIVSGLREKYPHIKRIYIRAEYPDINEDYTDYLLESYEETQYPDKLRNSGRAVYVERNQQMVDRCSVCVFYYKENYLPPPRKNSKRELTNYQPKSGTKTAYEYAVKKKKRIINVAP